MDNNGVMLAFVIVTAVAVVIQMAILVALFVTVKKSASRMEALTAQVQSRALPTLETAQSMITEYRPKLNIVVDNLVDSTTMVREKLKQFEPATSDLAERARQRVIEVDNIVGRILQHVDEASEMVHKGVSTPLKQASGVAHAVAATLATLFGRGNYNKAKKGTPMPKDDMFV